MPGPGVEDFGRSESEPFVESPTVPENPFHSMEFSENQETNKKFGQVDTSAEPKTSRPEPSSGNDDGPKNGSNLSAATPLATSRTIDVDSFASLLMKGVASPSESEHSSRSSFTLPSFGISDPLLDHNPLTSHPPSQLGQGDSRRESSESTETKAPMTVYNTIRFQDARKLDKPKVPPPPPKSRHGKTLSPTLKGPQTVPFDAFFPSIESNVGPRSVSDAFPVIVHDVPQPYVAAVRTNSYSSASLPILTSLNDHREKSVSIDSISDNSLASPYPSETKRALPPPVPLARRSTVNRRQRANTASSNISQAENGGASYAASIAESIESTHKPAPPPPPTRRAGSSSTIPKTSDFLTDATCDKNTEGRNNSTRTTRTRSNSGASLTSPPPRPPARRRSTRQSTELSRQNSLGGGSASHSRRASTDMPRSSLDSQRWPPSDAAYGTPIVEEVRVDAPISNPSNIIASSRASVDILADMEAFQREIDELRARSQ